MRRRDWLRGALFGVLGALGLGCLSPTLPLPPPSLPTVSEGSEPSTFRLKSDRGALPNALIVVLNRNEAMPRADRVAATLADEQGSWELEVIGAAGDVVDVSQEVGTVRSPTVSVTLR